MRLLLVLAIVAAVICVIVAATSTFLLPPVGWLGVASVLYLCDILVGDRFTL